MEWCLFLGSRKDLLEYPTGVWYSRLMTEVAVAVDEQVQKNALRNQGKEKLSKVPILD